MPRTSPPAEAATERDAPVSPRLMWINADRAIYCGLLGHPTVRRLGGHAIYLSPRGSHRIQVESGGWQTGTLSVVPPYLAHRVTTDEPSICKIVIESETVDSGSLPRAVQAARGVIDDARLIERIQRALTDSRPSADWPPQTTVAFDERFFDRPFTRTILDPRIQTTRVRHEPLQVTDSYGSAV